MENAHIGDRTILRILKSESPGLQHMFLGKKETSLCCDERCMQSSLTYRRLECHCILRHVHL